MLPCKWLELETHHWGVVQSGLHFHFAWDDINSLNVASFSKYLLWVWVWASLGYSHLAVTVGNKTQLFSLDYVHGPSPYHSRNVDQKPLGVPQQMQSKNAHPYYVGPYIADTEGLISDGRVKTRGIIEI